MQAKQKQRSGGKALGRQPGTRSAHQQVMQLRSVRCLHSRFHSLQTQFKHTAVLS